MTTDLTPKTFDLGRVGEPPTKEDILALMTTASARTQPQALVEQPTGPVDLPPEPTPPSPTNVQVSGLIVIGAIVAGSWGARTQPDQIDVITGVVVFALALFLTMLTRYQLAARR